MTFLSYRYAGLRQTDTTTLVYWMKDAGAKEGGPAHSRPSVTLFNEWLHAASDQIALPLSMVDMGDRWQADAIHSTLKHHVPAQAHYLAEVVLPRMLTYHESRLGATGEELGDRAVFAHRLAYTGTPNSLLPEAMGECCYEELADGRMLDTLASREHVVLEKVVGKWDVRSLLASVAMHDPPLCALIDPGALIVGMSNKDVAQTLLDCGLAAAGMQGVVFLDSNDHRMILLLNGRVMALEEAGVAPRLRFTFFDQLHTMGMDIPQPGTGRAAVLVGKDMRLRDYTQACWRMRGIGAGQIIHTMVVDEVSRLVARVASTANPAADVLAWLTLNEIQYERLQGVRLKALHTHTEERRPAFEALMQKDSVRPEHVAPYLANHISLMHQDTSTINDRDMEAEVEVEKEMEVENQTTETKPWVQYWQGYAFDEAPWSLDALGVEAEPAERDADVQFWRLRDFQPSSKNAALPFPPTVAVSRNHSFPTKQHQRVHFGRDNPETDPDPDDIWSDPRSVQREGAPSRVKNVRCIIVWTHKGARRVAAVSLAEAETLRWLLHNAPERLKPYHLSLWDAVTCANIGGTTAEGEPPTLAELGALRFFNCDVWLDPPMVEEIRRTLEGVSSTDVSLYAYQMMSLRRRDWTTMPQAFEGSPVGLALSRGKL